MGNNMNAAIYYVGFVVFHLIYAFKRLPNDAIIFDYLRWFCWTASEVITYVYASAFDWSSSMTALLCHSYILLMPSSMMRTCGLDVEQSISINKSIYYFVDSPAHTFMCTFERCVCGWEMLLQCEISLWLSTSFISMHMAWKEQGYCHKWHPTARS